MVRDRIKSAVAPTIIRLSAVNKRIALNTIMIRSFLASIFFIISLGVFTTMLRYGGNLIKVFVVVYGAALLIFFSLNIVAYLINITKVATSKALNFPFIMFVNTFLGFISQLFFFNLTLAIVIRTLVYIKHVDSLICEIKCSIVNFYYNTEIYTQISSLIWWICLLTIVAFIIGNYFVWLKDIKK